MQLSNEQIESFRNLHKTHFGYEISREEAARSGQQLVQLMRRVYKPMSQKEYRLIKKVSVKQS